MSRVFNLNNYVHTPHSAVYDTLSAFTIGAWIFPTSFGSGGADNNPLFIVKDPANFLNSNDGTGFYLEAPSSPFTSYTLQGSVVTTGNAANTLGSTTVPINQWAFVTMTYSNSSNQVRLFFNGTEISYFAGNPVTGTGSVANNSADGWYFGDDGQFANDGLIGRIAEVAIWNAVLTGAQIAAAAASTSGLSGIASGNLVGYWHLCGTASPEPDSSGNGNNAALGFFSGGNPTQGPDSPGFNCAGGPGPSVTVLTADFNPQQARSVVHLTATVT